MVYAAALDLRGKDRATLHTIIWRHNRVLVYGQELCEIVRYIFFAIFCSYGSFLIFGTIVIGEIMSASALGPADVLLHLGRLDDARTSTRLRWTVLLGEFGEYSQSEALQQSQYSHGHENSGCDRVVGLQKTLSSETSAGAIVNIVANDVNRLNQVMIYVHYIWSAPLLTIAVSGLVYVQVGFKPLIGVVVLIALVFIQVYTGKLSAEQRRETSSKTDERVRLMDEIISGVQVIKMYAWEKPFGKLIELVRHLELRMFRKTCYPRSFYMTSYIFATRLSLFFALVLMVFTKVPLVPREIFLVASFYNALAESLIAQLVRGYPEIVESSVTVARVKSFLMLSECKREDNVHYIKNISTTSRKKTNDVVFKTDVDKSIILKDLTVKWRPEAPKTILESVNLEMDKGKLYAIIGKVGSGKSSLLAAILGETHLVDGCAIVNGQLSYLHQNSWVFASTVHRNVVFCEKVDERRYRGVIDVCCLGQDFEQFPEGDRTVVGEKGVSLSGGQKARISLARAVYRQADIYLLDDPLSAIEFEKARRKQHSNLGLRLRGLDRPHRRLQSGSFPPVLLGLSAKQRGPAQSGLSRRRSSTHELLSCQSERPIVESLLQRHGLGRRKSAQGHARHGADILVHARRHAGHLQRQRDTRRAGLDVAVPLPLAEANISDRRHEHEAPGSHEYIMKI
ncbi:unnamed protein product [Trichogramma brassicae]|uniref:ABC transmembrane type-1 domain-containing protein n=1 Tax=Trichogramma brassicae TaxID=86971 RepID=A0A6H5IDF4_9HYME|nr:unnamed protein product [Trichogramma brassicae]